MRIFHINTTLGYNAPGRLVETLARGAAALGHPAAVAFDRLEAVPDVAAEAVGSPAGRIFHALQTRLFDLHGHGSRAATGRLLHALDEFRPDVVHLHNLHGYWLNIPILFRALARRRVRVVWTLHDFWPFTGHCAFPAQAGCDRWLTGCHACPQLNAYPASWGADRSRRNWLERRRWLEMLPRPTLVAVSDWQRRQIAAAVGDAAECTAIHNPVDTDIFCPGSAKSDPRLVLGAASVWDARKGLDRFIALRAALPTDYRIALAGLTKRQARSLPTGIVGVPRLGTPAEMAAFLGSGAVFVNLSRAETLGMVNLEARCCGTPVVSLAAAGMAETVEGDSGFLIEDFSAKAVADRIMEAAAPGRFSRSDIARRAAAECAPAKAIGQYMRLYGENL